MNFRAIFPLVDIKDEYSFDNCRTNEEFLLEIIRIYFSSQDDRIQEATLAVYMAYRDHYPRYLRALSNEQIEKLNTAIASAPSKVIKLRRIALSALSKVA